MGKGCSAGSEGTSKYSKANKLKIADFLNVYTLYTQQLICAITYQNIRGKGWSVVLKVFSDVRDPLGFIAIDQKSHILRNVYNL